LPTILTHTVELAAPPEAVYDYVTRPWRWHEWHPASKSATVAARPLETGDTFEEDIELRPLSPLPLRLRRRMTYRVVVAEPPLRWEVRGDTGDGWVSIRYAIQPHDGGSRFTRTLSYQTRGLTALLTPLLEPRMAAQSRVALERLRQRLANGQPG
jgi:uncharacterized protein YndB with AHSA1/START domain